MVLGHGRELDVVEPRVVVDAKDERHRPRRSRDHVLAAVVVALRDGARPAELDAADEDDANPDVAGLASGTFVAIWTFAPSGSGPTELHFARSTDFGATWSPSEVLNGSVPSVASPRVAAAAGTWMAGWAHVATERDIKVARSTDDGATWGAPVALDPLDATDTGDEFLCGIETDGDGNWFAVWTTEGGALGDDKDIAFSRSVDDGLTWSAPAPFNATATTDGSDDDDACRDLAYDGATDTWMVLWEEEGSGNGSSVSTDDGATWSAHIAVPFALADSVAGSAGIWVVAYGTFGGNPGISTAASSDDGATWTTPVPVNEPFVGIDKTPAVAGTGGSFVVSWEGDSPQSAPSNAQLDIYYAATFSPFQVPALPVMGAVLLVATLAMTGCRRLCR